VDPTLSVRYEIRIEAQHDGNASSFLHRAVSGNPARVEQSARSEFTRVKLAMQGHDTNIFADHFVTATLLKGEPPNQEVVETYTKEG